MANSPSITLRPIAHIKTDFPDKFGIPRQSGLVKQLKAFIQFEPEFAVPEAVRGLEGFSHLWLIWQFSNLHQTHWSPTVRPPRLGGNKRMGVFATRSPFRPNPIGLSCVKLDTVELDPQKGPILHILGADLMDNTPILDIKPYLPQADCHTEASCGFTACYSGYALQVHCPPELLLQVPEDKRAGLLGVLAQDPRPSYQKDPTRVYGMRFAGLEVRFTVQENLLTVQEIFSACK